MTYQDLIEAVEAYLVNSEEEFVDQIDRFVRLTEQKIYRRARLPATRVRGTVSLSSGTATASWPTGFLLPLSASVVVSSADVPLLLKDVSWIKEAYPDSTATAQPRVYGNLSNTLMIVAPTPDATYTVNLDYLKFPNSIVDDNKTWLGDNAEEALLYGTLVEAYGFNKGEPDMLQYYQAKFDEALALLAQEAQAANQDEYLGTTVI